MMEFPFDAYVHFLTEYINNAHASAKKRQEAHELRKQEGMMKILGYDLEQTCSACPEQYDVYLDGKQVGYLRLRHGHFTAEVPDAGGEEVYESKPDGDGLFTFEEREGELTKAIEAIDKHRRSA